MTSPLSKASCPAMSEPTCKKVFIATVSILAIAALVGTVLLSIQASGNPTPGLITAATCLGVLTALSITSSLVLTLHKKQTLEKKRPIPLIMVDQKFPNVHFKHLDVAYLHEDIERYMSYSNSATSETCPKLPQYSHMQFLQFLLGDGNTHKGVSKADAQKCFMRKTSDAQKSHYSNEYPSEVLHFLFPTQELDPSHPNVPPLTTEEYQILRLHDAYTKPVLATHLKLILNYYGMDIFTNVELDEYTVLISPKAFKLIEDSDFCTISSRILSSLKYFGCRKEFTAFSTTLLRLHSEITSQPRMSAKLRQQFIQSKPAWDAIINS